IKTLDGLAENSICEMPQPEVANPKNAFKIFKDDLRINWKQDGAKVHNFIRGMSQYPCAFTVLKIGEEQKSLKIFKGKFVEDEHSEKAGSLKIDKNTFKIFTTDGAYFPEEIQLEGKKRMNVKDFLNGFRDYDHIVMATEA